MATRSVDPRTKIITTNGFEVEIDPEDRERLSRYSWRAVLSYVSGTGHKGYYAMTAGCHEGASRYVQMHRLIMGLPKCLVDHRDRNGLNNRRDNLRLATRSQNNANCVRPCGAIRFRGVVRSRSKASPFFAQIGIRGRNTYLGSFADEESAARAYDDAAIKHHGEFAQLNFPEAVRVD